MKKELTDETLIWVKALKDGDLEKVKHLERLGAFVPNMWQHMSYWYAKNGNSDMVKYLSEEKGVDFWQSRHNKELWASLEGDHLEVFKYLSGFVADTKQMEEEALLISIAENKPKIRNYLLKEGVDPGGCTPNEDQLRLLAKMALESLNINENKNETTELENENTEATNER